VESHHREPSVVVSPLPTDTADDEICATLEVSDSETSKPLLPAGPVSVMVAVAALPPATVAGEKVTEAGGPSHSHGRAILTAGAA
jgi:hypothetical protein